MIAWWVIKEDLYARFEDAEFCLAFNGDPEVGKLQRSARCIRFLGRRTMLMRQKSLEGKVRNERVGCSVSMVPYTHAVDSYLIAFCFRLVYRWNIHCRFNAFSSITREPRRHGSDRADTSILPLQSLQDTYHECDGFSRWIDSNSGASHHEQAQTRNIKLANEAIIDDINKLRKYTWPVHRQDIDDCPINSGDNDSA